MPDPGLDPQQNSPQPDAAPAGSQNVTTGAPAPPAAPAANPAPPATLEFMPPTPKPDGGVLGKAALGSLEAASDAQNPPPQSLEFVPQSINFNSGTGAPPQSSWWDTAKKVLTFNPLLTPINYVAGKTAGVADEAVQNRDQANLVAAAHGQQSPYSTIGTLALRAAKDTAGLVEGASSPASAGLAAVAATGPIGVTASGLYTVGHGAYDLVQGWGDVSNPDVLQNELNAAAETVGGAAGLSEGARGVMQSYKNATVHNPESRYEQFQNAAPSTKSARYTKADFAAAEKYLEAEHMKGTSPMEGEDAIRNGVESATSAISKIEHNLATVIDANPDEPVLFRDASGQLSPIDPITDASTALQGSVRKDFLLAGMKELENYPLNPLEDGPLTLQKADDIRKQLNADNDATLNALQAKGKYAIDRAMQTDPAFSARQAAAEALRSGIYDTTERLGLVDARQMRLDEGSLIKVRRALQNQVDNAEKPVKTNKKPSTIRKVAQKAVIGGGAALGFEMGAKIGHPLIGSAMGAEAGAEAARMLTPEKLTRNQWLEKAFEPITAPAPINGQYPITGIPTQMANTPGIVASQAPPAGYIHVQGSDGSEHYIPEAQLETAKQADPHLQILNAPQPAPQQ